MPATGGGFQIPDFEDFAGFKGGGSSGVGGGTGGLPPGGSLFGPAGGGGSAFTGIGPSYERGVPQFGYRRRPSGPVPNSRTMGAVSSPGGVQPNAYGAQSAGVDAGSGPQPATAPNWGGGANWYGGGQAPQGPWTIPQYIQNAQGAGAFDPMGSQGIMDAISAQYGQGYGQAQRGVRNGLLASGVDDPNAYAYGQLQGDLNAQGQYSQAMQQARLQSMLQNQQFLQSVFGSNQNFAQGNYQQGTQQRFNQMNQPKTGLGQTLGTIGGAALGSFLGPMGTAAGASIGGNLFGGGGGSSSGVTPMDYGLGSVPGFDSQMGGYYGYNPLPQRRTG